MPNGDTRGPNLNKPKEIIWGATITFFVFLLWVLDKEAGWGLWPF